MNGYDSAPSKLPMKTKMLAFAAAASILASFAAEDWPNWRGPNFNGSIASGQFPAKWSDQNIAWKIRLPGKGTSVPIVHKDRIYITTPLDGEDAVIAYDFAGKELWKTKLGPASAPKHRSLASSSNASPVTDGKHVFAYFKSGTLTALDLEGKVVWKDNLVEKYGRENLFWDTGTSPTVNDKHLIVARMHSGESWLAAFDKATGKLAWKEGRNFQVPNENDNGYTTPLFANIGNKPAIILWGADHLTAHDAATGKTMWAVGEFNPKATGFWPGIATPVIVDDIAILPVGRDDRNQANIAAVKLAPGSGDVTKTHRLWTREDTGIFVPTPAAHKGRVYLLRNRGEIVCLDPKTGKTLFTFQLPEHRTPYYASPTIANGILYAAREDGAVFTAKIHDDKLELTSENNLGERLIATPVPFGDNRILFRGDNHLFCIK